MTRPAFFVFGIPVFIPTSASLGFGLISWFALPTAESLVGTGITSIGLALVFGAAVYVAILIHEIGHALTARRFGYAVDHIVLHFFGGHTLLAQKFLKPSHLGIIGFAGPAANALTALVAFLIYRNIDDGIVSSVLAWLLWSTSAMAFVNLLPGTPLDGGSIVQAVVWKISGNQILARKVSAVLGIGVAALWVFSPFILNRLFEFEVTQTDVFISAFVGMWLATGAWNAYRAAGVQEPVVQESYESFPRLEIRDVVRKSIAVDIEVSCEEALATANQAGAGSILVTSAGHIVGIVRQAAFAAVPESLRKTTKIGTTARQCSQSEAISVSISSGEVIELLNKPYEQEWLVEDDNRRIVGVLHRTDVEKALSQGV